MHFTQGTEVGLIDTVQLYLGAHADDAAGNAYADCSEASLML